MAKVLFICISLIIFSAQSQNVIDASKQKVDDAKGFNRKLQGKRASKTENQPTPTNQRPKPSAQASNPMTSSSSTSKG